MHTFFLSLFGIGFIPRLGAVVAAIGTGVICFGLDRVLPAFSLQRFFIIGVLFFLIFLLALFCVPLVEHHETFDHYWIVIDEFLGVLLACSLLLILQPSSMTLFDLALILVLFGFFDYIKPLGIRVIDRKEHWPPAVIIDDILAGTYAAVLSYILLLILR